jgi:dTDP-D-glucose 4,6-dehydratase
MEHYDGEEHINVGTGEDLSIRELAETIRDIVAPGVAITFDPSKPDGTPRKLLDVQRLHDLGWRHQIELGAGIASTYDWFCTEMTAEAHSSVTYDRHVSPDVLNGEIHHALDHVLPSHSGGVAPRSRTDQTHG